MSENMEQRFRRLAAEQGTAGAPAPVGPVLPVCPSGPVGPVNDDGPVGPVGPGETGLGDFAYALPWLNRSGM